MFTTPDHSDAVAPNPPPFSSVGPKPDGFYQDCDPDTGVAGTRPRAEEFNELALNLRRLMTDTATATTKGDPLMLITAIRALIGMERPVITTVTNLFVSPGGVPNPVNPIAGNPFNSLPSALAWLERFEIRANVIINIAAGTYVHTAMIDLWKPDYDFLFIIGAGMDATILRFNGISGLAIPHIDTLGQLTVEGDTAGGLAVHGIQVFTPVVCAFDRVRVRNFGGHGIVVGGALSATTLEVVGNGGNGVNVRPGRGELAVVQPTQLIATNNAGAEGNVFVGGTANIHDLQATGGVRGIMVGGPAASATLRTVYVLGASANATNAVFVTDGAILAAPIGVTASWRFISAEGGGGVWGVLRAEYNALVRAQTALTPENRTITSPAVNTLGNFQAYIQAT